MDQQSVKYLFEIADIYRKITPVISIIRQDETLAEHTFIPNILSPIVPGLASGCDKDIYNKADDMLNRCPHWNDYKRDIKDNYDAFCKVSGNSVSWVVWNFWKPSDIEIDPETRIIQVMSSSDFELAGFINTNTNLLTLNKSVLTTNSFFDKPIDDHHIYSILDTCSIYTGNIWRRFFSISRREFYKSNIDTIVDYLRRRYIEYHQEQDIDKAIDALKPVEFFVDPNETKIINRSDVQSFSISEKDLDKLWNIVENESSNIINNDVLETIISVWLNISCQFNEQQNQLPSSINHAVSEFSKMLSIKKADEAYVILQHFCWFAKAMLANYQYTIPLTYGDNVSVLYITFKKRLSKEELKVWCNIGSQIFSSLFIEHLNKIYLEDSERKRASKQREMLSHALPKFVFKPLEFFMIRVNRLASEIKADNISKMAKTCWFLIEIGQQQLRHYAEIKPNRSNINNFESADLVQICGNIGDIFKEIKDLFVYGICDRFDESDNINIREHLITGDTLSLKIDKKHNGKLLVIGNETIHTMHIWNLIENSFIHSKIPNKGNHNIFITLEYKENEYISIKVSSENSYIKKQMLDILNKLFLTPCNTRDFSKVCDNLKKLALTNNTGYDFDHEDHGRGLIAFAEYLFYIWSFGNEYKKSIRGIFEPIGTTLECSFFYPIYKD